MRRTQTLLKAHERLTQFSEDAETASLDVLRHVEETFDALTRYERLANELIDDARSAIHRTHRFSIATKEGSSGCVLDADDKIVTQLATVEEIIEELVDSFKASLRLTREAPELNGGHDESVADCYERTIDRFCRAHELITELRWLIMEHDADHDNEVVGSYENPGDLIASLKR